MLLHILDKEDLKTEHNIHGFLVLSFRTEPSCFFLTEKKTDREKERGLLGLRFCSLVSRERDFVRWFLEREILFTGLEREREREREVLEAFMGS